MLITRDFVFVHTPKTGGNFIRRAWEGREVEVLDWHLGAGRIPTEHSHLPVFAVVRNPWDWYASLYHYMQGRDFASDDPWRVYSGEGTLDFQTTVRNACGGVPSWFDRWDYDYFRGVCFWLFAHDKRVEVGRLESIREDFGNFCDRHGIARPDCLDTLPRRTAPNVPRIASSTHPT